MKVILQQDVKKLGKKGDIVEVSEGYGRNFLLPRKAAVPATAQNLNVANAAGRLWAPARGRRQLTRRFPWGWAQLEKVEVKIPVRIGEGGKLFGSVTAARTCRMRSRSSTSTSTSARSPSRVK